MGFNSAFKGVKDKLFLTKVYRKKTSWHVAAKTDSKELLQIIMEPAKEKLTTKELSYKFWLTKKVRKKILASGSKEEQKRFIRENTGVCYSSSIRG